MKNILESIRAKAFTILEIMLRIGEIAGAVGERKITL